MAAGLTLGDMHREHRRRDRGNRATSAGVLSGGTAGTRDGNACEVNEGENTVQRGEGFVGSRSELEVGAYIWAECSVYEAMACHHKFGLAHTILSEIYYTHYPGSFNRYRCRRPSASHPFFLFARKVGVAALKMEALRENVDTTMNVSGARWSR